MADLEAVLADVSYLMAMEKSKCTPAARASKKIALPDPSVRSVMVKYLEKAHVQGHRRGPRVYPDPCREARPQIYGHR